MKNMKKNLLAILMVFAFCLQSVCIAAEESTEPEKLPPDKEAQLMLDLGFFAGNAKTYDGNKTVTRAEFAVILANICGFDTKTTNSPSFYLKDSINVSEYPSIWQVVDAGLMHADSDGIFRPNENIKNVDVAEAILRLLGRGVFLTRKDGEVFDDYAHYVMSGVNAKYSDESTLSVIADMLYNSFDLDIYEQVIYPTNIAFEKSEGETILSKYQNIYSSSGVVTADYLTSINEEGSVIKGEILIDDGRYSEGKSGASEYLGECVDFYYRYDADTPDIMPVLCSVSVNRKTTVYEVNSEDVLDTTTNSEFCYELNNKDKKLHVSTGCSVVYNYKFYERACNVKASTFMPETGKIKLIDNNDDGYMDVVMIQEYKTAVVQTVYEAEEKIVFKNGVSSVAIDNSDHYRILMNGKTAELNDILSGTVVELYVPMYGDIFVINILTETVTGEITSVLNEEAENGTFTESVKLGGQEYDVSRAFRNKDWKSAYTVKGADGLYVNISPLQTGKSAEFTLDSNGKIVYMDTTSVDYEYGYMVKVYEDTEYEPAKYKVKIFDSMQNMSVYELREKITLDGYSGKKGKDVITALKSVAETPGGVNSMVKFKTDKDGLITHLDTLNVNRVEDDPDQLTKTILAGRLRCMNSGVLASLNSYERVIINSGCVTFLIPNEPKSDKEYMISNGYIKSTQYYDDVEVYDIKNNRVSIVKFTIDTSNVGGIGDINLTDDPLHVVSKVVSAIDDEGEPITLLKTFANKAELETMIDEDTRIVNVDNEEKLLTTDSLHTGDLLYIDKDLLGYGNVILKLNPLQIKDQPYFVNGSAGYTERAYGQVVDYTDRILKVRVGDGKNDCVIYNVGSPQVSVCNLKTKKVTTGSLNDLLPSEDSSVASKVFVRCRLGDVKQIVVFQ